MGKHCTLGIYDYDREKICELYDSNIDLVGQAFGIRYTIELNGFHTLEFSIPHMIDAYKIIGSDIESLYGEAIYNISKFGRTRQVDLSELKNYRWNYLRSDYLIRYTCDDKTVWFIANKPTKSKSGKNIIGTVVCSGYESLLKTRNIYMTFDDTNGIGTIKYLMDQILLGTGWSFDDANSDTLYERDGTTEKIRSLVSDGKKGALDLVVTVCNLFQARPIFDTENHKVSIKSMNNREQVIEGNVGRNLNTLSISSDSSNMATRIYVEGEYGDYGYVGIDDVKVDADGNVSENGKEWGLPFLVNFDYYKEIGTFKPRHEAALETYLRDIRAKKAEIRAKGLELTACENMINAMIGQCKLAVYYKSESLVTPAHIYGSVTDEQAALAVNDDVVILENNGTISYEKWTGTPVTQLAGAYGVVKFVTKAAGSIGASEVQVESKEKEIERLRNKIDTLAEGDSKIPEYESEIVRLQKEIDAIFVGYKVYDEMIAYAVGDKCCYNGQYGDNYTYGLAKAYECASTIVQHDTAHPWNPVEWQQTDMAGLFKMMHNVMSQDGMFNNYDNVVSELNTLNSDQDDIEATFISAMGYMLRDGYWSNQNYVDGQQAFLYADAVDMTKEMSRPEKSVTFSYVGLTEEYDIQEEDIEINAVFRVWDDELDADENMYIKKITYGVDNKMVGNIEVTNQDITLTGNDIGSLLSRMSQLADLIEQKNALYERAKAISQSGSIFANRLNGQIDVVKNQILSSISNWHTDDNGNIIFVSADESSAMMLSGAGFMLASGKDEDNQWAWRTLGTGHGIIADEIVAGFISADRIEAGTISVSKLEPGIGASIDISENESISTLSGEIDDVADDAHGAIQTVNNIINGVTAVPKVTSTGISIYDNYLQIQTTGEMQILGNGKVYVGSSSSNSAVVIDKDGIAIGTQKSIAIGSGGKITIESATGLEIGTGTNMKTLNDYALISMVPGSISALTFDAFGNSGSVQISPTKITIGSSGSIDLSAANEILLKSGSVTLSALASGVQDTINKAANITVDSSGKIVLSALSSDVQSTINKAAGITVDSSGKIVLSALSSSVQSTLNNSVSQSTLENTLDNYAEISMIPTSISMLTFDTFGDSSKVEISPQSINIGTSGSINIKSGSTTNILINNNGIEMAGKYIKIKSGNNVAVQIDQNGIDMQTAGKFYLHAGNGTASAIMFGNDASTATFSVGQSGDIICNSITVKNLSVDGAGIPNFIVSDSEPSGNNIVWIRPSGTDEKTWAYRPSAYVMSKSGGSLGYYLDTFCPYSQQDFLTGNVLYYGIRVRFSFNGLAQGVTQSYTLKARLKNGSNWIDLGTASGYAHQWDVITIDTMLSSTNTNIMSSSGGNFEIWLESSRPGSEIMIMVEDIRFTARTTSTGSFSACSVYYKQ